ncbi:MAG: hypothetical protein U0836_05070 [Pirellulales bacterium]
MPRPWVGEPLRSADLVLVRLSTSLQDATGSDDAVSPNGTLIDYLLAADAFDEIDLVDLWFRWEHEFGLDCPRQEWLGFFQLPAADHARWLAEVGPQLTFAALAEFIANRLPALSCEPVTVLGRPCRAAGVFVGIEKLVGAFRSGRRSFGPSTPLRRVLSADEAIHLQRALFWSSGGRYPEPCIPWACFSEDQAVNLWGLRVAIMIMLVAIAFPLAWGGMAVDVVALLGILLSAPFLVYSACRWLYRRRTAHWPPGVRTFRDLVRRYLAAVGGQPGETPSS